MNKFLKSSIILLLVVFAFNACQDDYLTDGGVSKSETSLTVYDYLNTNRYDMFDSLIVIIDSLKLKDTINNAGTYFAPNDYNIELYLKIKTTELQELVGPDTVYSFNSLLKDPDLASDFILQYAFKDKITLQNDVSTAGIEYTNLAGNVVIVKKIKTDDAAYYKYTDDPVYFLYYCKEGKENERCQTTDILTQNGNGTVLHALNNGHIFNRFTAETVD